MIQHRQAFILSDMLALLHVGMKEWILTQRVQAPNNLGLRFGTGFGKVYDSKVLEPLGL